MTKEGRSGGATWSPDGKWISTSTGEPTQRLTSSPPYSGPLMVHVGSRFNERDALLVSSDGRKSQIVEKSPDNESIVEWSPDSTRFVLERTSIDVKDRTLFLCDVEPLACKPFLRHRDEKYLPSNDQMVSFSPDGKSILFTSDKSGWNHLYVTDGRSENARQLTDGAFEISFASWNHDGSRIFFSSTEVSTAERHLYSMAPAGGERVRLTTTPGVNTTLAVSPTRDDLAFVRSDPRQLPDFWMMEGKAARRRVRSPTRCPPRSRPTTGRHQRS